MEKKIGLIRVLTTEDTHLLNSHGRVVESRFRELKVESRCIDDQPTGIYDEETSAVAVPKIVALGEEMERAGAEAIIES